MDLELFFGRFHPLIVHLPIGFLLLAALMEGLAVLYKKKFGNLNAAIGIALLLGGIGAVASAVIGYLLAGAGGYDESTLELHKWMGIGLAVFSFVGWILKVGYLKVSLFAQRAIIFSLVVIVSITGHLGGNLTHGSDYLVAYAPEFVKEIAGVETELVQMTDLPLRPDSIKIFKHLVKPILEAKCVACHNPAKTQGGLLMTTVEGLSKGGNSGASFHAGKPMDSELFLRTTLPQSSQKFMPPKGEPLSYTELKLIEWWITEGASFDASIAEVEPSKKIKSLLLRDYNIDTSPRPYYDLVQVDPLKEETIEELARAGWQVTTLAADHPMLEVSFRASKLTVSDFDPLLKAAKNITWIDLSGVQITEGALAAIDQITHLTRLDLSKSRIMESELSSLKGLRNLELLNLHSTPISDAAIDPLSELKSLGKLFVWQTEITEEGVKALKASLTKSEIISGFDTASKPTS
ncbi:MAG: c-type cytochrome domain-containing protein [Bacteroidota bacterium]